VSNFYTGSVGSPACDTDVPDPPGGGSRTLLALQEGVLGGNRPSGREAEVPTVISLSRAYPNPVRSGVKLDLAVPEDRVGLYVLEVYDVRGRRILESRREIAAAGRYTVDWGGTERGGNRAAAGVYFLRLKGPMDFVETRKVTLLR
jgi:hypothetical protein